MTFLVAMTPVHQRVLAEDVFDRPAQRLAAVDDEQDRLVGIEATVDEIGQQRPGQRGVLGAAFPEPERDLDALRRDAERDDVGALGDFDAVEHHHREAHVVEAARPSAHLSAVRVRSMNMSETAVLPVAEADCSTSLPTGSPTRANLLVETPASIRSITARVNESRSAKYS